MRSSLCTRKSGASSRSRTMGRGPREHQRHRACYDRVARMLLRRLAFVAAVFATLFFFTGVALADKVAVLPFRSSKNVPRPELEEARKWTREAVTKKGHTLPSDSEMVSAEMAVKDGIADVSTEYKAAGRASGSKWAIGANVERIDYPPDGK